MKDKAPRFYIVFVRIWLAGLALLFSWLLWNIFSSPFARSRFDEKIWAAASSKPDDDDCTRGQMANDLLENHTPIGMEKKRLLALLGKPDKDSGSEGVYYLGFCEGPIDADALHFYFDTNEKLTKHAIINH